MLFRGLQELEVLIRSVYGYVAYRIGDGPDAEDVTIALRYGADLKVKQIAAALEERTNTVEVALHCALGRLRRILEDAGDEEPAKTGTAAL